MGELIHEKSLDNLTVEELVAVLSIFTNLKLSEQNKIYNHQYINCNETIKNNISNINKKFNKYYDIETKYKQILQKIMMSIMIW